MGRETETKRQREIEHARDRERASLRAGSCVAARRRDLLRMRVVQPGARDIYKGKSVAEEG